MIKHSKLEIVCASCGQDNTFETSFPIVCKECNEPLSDSGSYSRFGALAGVIMLGVGAGGALGVAAITEDNRYPVLVEHAIIEECISNSRKPLSRRTLLNKRILCVCALEETQNELDVDDWTQNRPQFISVFEKQAKECYE